MIAELPGRRVIGVSGSDRVAFLNGLVSNDVGKVLPGRAIWAAFLTAQGKYFADFFIFAEGERLLLDAPGDAVDLAARLRRYRLRADALVEELPDHRVYAAWDGAAPEAAVVAADPRLAEAGFRIVSASHVATNAASQQYAAWRLGLGLPDGPPDLEVEKTLLLEAGFDELNGVDWLKGCYMGQELTARTKYRGLIKRRLVPVTLQGDLAPPGTPVLSGGVEVGTLRSGLGSLALATLRLDALRKPLLAGDALLTPLVPGWMKLPG